jgi:hypothetical protein
MPLRIGGMRLTWQGEAPYVVNCCGTDTVQVRGVHLYYGGLDTSTGRLGSPGDPAYAGRFISITEFERPNAVTRQLGRLHFPPEGTAVLDAGDVEGAGAHNATLRAHGAYAIISASTDADVLAAARALTATR